MERTQEAIGGFRLPEGVDARLKKTADILFVRMVAQQSVCLRRLGGGRAGEVRFGRFIVNRRVSVAARVHGACADVDERSAGRHVLAIQDSSEINSLLSKTAEAWRTAP